MTTATYSNLPIGEIDATKSFFENFFNQRIAISENEINAIVGYFQKRTPNKDAANALALAVINGAVEQNLPPMEILDQFKRLPQDQIDTYLAYFLNLTRYPTSLVGLSNVPAVSKYVARSILP
tara:strand:+ start:667 stop:1035 length:369 start_codon:yes stop_codon:yes gene_type:complete